MTIRSMMYNVNKAFHVALLVLTVSPSNAMDATFLEEPSSTSFSFEARKRGGGYFNSWKKRYFSFRGSAADDADALCYYMYAGDQMKGSINLAGATLHAATPKDVITFDKKYFTVITGLTITTKDTGRTYYLAFDDTGAWTKAWGWLRQAINLCNAPEKRRANRLQIEKLGANNIGELANKVLANKVLAKPTSDAITKGMGLVATSNDEALVQKPREIVARNTFLQELTQHPKFKKIAPAAPLVLAKPTSETSDTITKGGVTVAGQASLALCEPPAIALCEPPAIEHQCLGRPNGPPGRARRRRRKRILKQ